MVLFAKKVVQKILKNPNITNKKDVAIDVLTSMRYGKKKDGYFFLHTLGIIMVITILLFME